MLTPNLWQQIVFSYSIQAQNMREEIQDYEGHLNPGPLRRRNDSSTLDKRAPATVTDYERWDLALLAVPPGKTIDDGYYEPDASDPMDDQWATNFDDTRCEGQIIYLVETDVLPGHRVSSPAIQHSKRTD